MLHLILGGPGSGKTYCLDREISSLVSAGERTWLVVPEQATVSTERRMAELLPSSAPLCFEVSNFTRLADAVFRVCGGIGVTYATPVARLLTMWRTLGELSPLLRVSGGDQSGGAVKKMLSASRELAMSGKRTADLDAAALALGEGQLSDRLHDLSLTLSVYRSLIGERFADAESDLDAMRERITETPIFKGTHLAFDSFTGFTEQQYALLAVLLRQADVTVTLPLPEDADAQLCYEEPRSCRERLCELASQFGVRVRETRLHGNRRTLSEPLALLSSQLFRTEPQDMPPVPRDGSVRLVSSATPYSAARFIAEDICRRVQTEGALYRDFAVVTANAEHYRGILDTALASAGIPCFSSERTDVSALEPMKLITSAYAVCIGGFRRSDVLTYIKCGFSGITVEEADAFALYTEKWRLSGKRITDGKPWEMNPDGYTDRLTPAGERTLSLVASAREKLLSTLLPLRGSAVRAPVPSHCRALCDFLLSLSLPERLRERAASLAERGEGERAELLARLWEIICDTLDTLADLLADSEVSAEEFVSLFRMVGDEVDIGRIPASEDEVLFGSAEMLRTDGIRHVYLLGAEEGEFPASAGQNGYFTEQERTVLRSVGLTIGQGNDMRASRELFFFLRALCSASVSATVLTASLGTDLTPRRPSSAVGRIRSLLGDACTELTVEQMPRQELLWSVGGALDRLGELCNEEIYPSLRDALLGDPRLKGRLDAVSVPIVNDRLRLSQGAAQTLYPKRISTTQSRIEKYMRCPFSHFCTYVLKLHSRELADFDNNEIGSYVHTMLEEFFRDNQRAGPRKYTDSELDALCTRISDSYLARVGQGQQSCSRMRRLWRSLRRSSKMLISHICEEFEQSEFTPRFFELKIGGNGENDPSPFVFVGEDGSELSIYGSVDRVDSYTAEDGRVYLRVIDYKTGSKTFRLEDVRRGLNLQMLLYLFALWKNKNPAFSRRLGIPDGESILPAGVLYMGAVTGEIRLGRPESREEVLRLASEEAKQNGLLLDDMQVLHAMEKGLGGRFIPVRLNRDGSCSKESRKNLASLDRMGELLREIGGILGRCTDAMRSGDISAYPRSFGEENCTFCEMRPICRARSDAAGDAGDE